MSNTIRKLFVAAVVAGGVLGTGGPVTAKNGIKGGTPFEVSASLGCDGQISWSVIVGTEEFQAVWVKVDLVTTIAITPTTVEGAYFGVTGGFDPLVSHTVLFRRLVEADVEEQAIVETGACLPLTVPTL
jgi:hypothetical protein